MSVENSKLKDPMNTFYIEHPVKEPSQLINCYKSVTPTCINLISTDQKYLLMKSSTSESDLSEFHKLTSTILRKILLQGNFKKNFYTSY